MQKKEKNAGSNQQLQSKLNTEQAWLQLTKKYLNDLPGQLEGIRGILKKKDYAAIKKQAHRIKGTSATYHLENISRSVAQLEQLAENKNPDKIATTINKIRQLVDSETSRLNAFTAISVNKSGGGPND